MTKPPYVELLPRSCNCRGYVTQFVRSEKSILPMTSRSDYPSAVQDARDIARLMNCKAFDGSKML